MIEMEKTALDSTDYLALYNDYWSREDRIGESSSDLEQTADQIVMTCGFGSTLDIGSGEGRLVAELLRHGVDAHGLDVSEVVVSRCNRRFPGRFTHGSVLSLPFPDESFNTVVSTDCMEHLAPEDVSTALKEIHRVAARYVYLKLATTKDRDGHWHLTVEGRAWWEAKCFEAGFRKHPDYYRINSYGSLNLEGWQIIVPLEKIPADALARYPLAALREERDLHMDMLREHGSRSDAHVVRYHFACSYVRPGDTVLDAACGLGYGSYVIRSLTKCSTVTGLDGSEYGIDYATAHFANDSTIRFTQGYLPDCLRHIPDNSVDCIISFETLEHVVSPEALLAEFHRILTPGGRLISSVPHDWSDETGQDPNPFHLHVYDRSKFASELAQCFEIEQFFGQTADRIKMPGGGCKWELRPRSLNKINPHSEDLPVEAEWLLAVACKSPLYGRDVPYLEKIFSEGEQAASANALAFARDYENPWLVRALVSIGLRTENRSLRERWAIETTRLASITSADYGAALCVLAYLDLEGSTGINRIELAEAIDLYISNEPAINPNALRWQVSLCYVQGLSELAEGQRESAKRYFKRVISLPAEIFSPTLLTKPADAAYFLGLLYAAEGEVGVAESIWQTSFNELLRRLGLYLASPYPALPPKFELQEISTVITLINRLGTAARNATRLHSQPSVFRDDVSGPMDALKGKAWLESEWKAGQAELLAKESYLAEVLEGKAWLESEWKAGQAELLAKESYLVEVLEGKAWLESEWKALQVELKKKQEGLESTEAGLQTVSAQLNRLQSALPVRVLRKIGVVPDV